MAVFGLTKVGDSVGYGRDKETRLVVARFSDGRDGFIAPVRARKLGQGDFVVIGGEKMKVGILGPGNAVAEPNGKVKGVLAVVQWYKRGEEYEKIAYNVTATSLSQAKRFMAQWMPRLHYPEFRESSRLVRIVKDTGTIAR